MTGSVADRGLGIFMAIAAFLALNAIWWCSQDCSAFGWALIIGVLTGPATVIVFALSFFIADRLGLFMPASAQIAAAGLLPASMIFFYFLPHNLDMLHHDHGSRPQYGILWQVFRDTVRATLFAVPSGVMGGFVAFYRNGLRPRQ